MYVLLNYSPELAVLSEGHVSIVVNGIGRSAHLEIHLVRVHILLELECVLRGHEARVLVIILEVVVHLGPVEFARLAQTFPSDSALVLLGVTSLIETQMVHIILCSLLLELVESLFSVGSPEGRWLLGQARLVPQLPPVLHVVLHLAHRLVSVRVLLATQIVRNPICTHRQYLIGLCYVSKLVYAGLMLVASADCPGIGMVLLDELPVSVLNLFWSGSRVNL